MWPYASMSYSQYPTSVRVILCLCVRGEHLHALPYALVRRCCVPLEPSPAVLPRAALPQDEAGVILSAVLQMAVRREVLVGDCQAEQVAFLDGRVGRDGHAGRVEDEAQVSGVVAGRAECGPLVFGREEIFVAGELEGGEGERETLDACGDVDGDALECAALARSPSLEQVKDIRVADGGVLETCQLIAQSLEEHRVLHLRQAESCRQLRWHHRSRHRRDRV